MTEKEEIIKCVICGASKRALVITSSGKAICNVCTGLAVAEFAKYSDEPLKIVK